MDLDEAFGLPLVSMLPKRQQTRSEESYSETSSQASLSTESEHTIRSSDKPSFKNTNMYSQGAVRDSMDRSLRGHANSASRMPASTPKAPKQQQRAPSLISGVAKPTTDFRPRTPSTHPPKYVSGLSSRTPRRKEFQYPLHKLSFIEGKFENIPDNIMFSLQRYCEVHKTQSLPCTSFIWPPGWLHRTRSGRAVTYSTASGEMLEASRFSYDNRQQIIVVRDPTKSWKAGHSVVIVRRPESESQQTWGVWTGQANIQDIPQEDLSVRRVICTNKTDESQITTMSACQTDNDTSPNYSGPSRLSTKGRIMKSNDHPQAPELQQSSTQVPDEDLDLKPGASPLTSHSMDSTIVVDQTVEEQIIEPVLEHKNANSPKPKDSIADCSVRCTKRRRVISISSDSDQAQSTHHAKVMKTAHEVADELKNSVPVNSKNESPIKKRCIVVLKFKAPQVTAETLAPASSSDDLPAFARPDLPTIPDEVKHAAGNMLTPEPSIGDDTHATNDGLNNIMVIFKDLGGSTTRVRPFARCNTSQTFFKQAWVAKLAYDNPIALAVTFADKQIRLWEDDEEDFQALRDEMQASLEGGWTDAKVVVTL